MKIRFSKTINLGNGMRVQLNKRGMSVSQKIGNVTITKRTNGKVRKTINVPGTGISLYEEN